MRNKIFTLTLFLLFFTNLIRVQAQVVLDNTYDTDGKANYSISSGNDLVSGAALQADGKIVVVGTNLDATQQYYQFFVARYLSNGFPDVTFNIVGFGEFNLFPNAHEYGYQPLVLSNGKILIALGKPAGFNGIRIMQLKSNGMIDSSFGTNGIAINPINRNTEQTSIAVQADGKIVIGGICNNEFPNTGTGFFIARFNANGSIDNTFNSTGYIVHPLNNSGATSGSKVVIDNSKNIYLCGGSMQSSNFVATFMCIDSTGTLKSTFDTDGILYYNHNQQFTTANDMLLDENGKLVVAGVTFYGSSADYRNLVFRLNPNGSFDNSFNSNGRFEFKTDSVNTISSIARDANNRIILGGSSALNLGSAKMTFHRLNTNGSLDQTFNPGGAYKLSWGFDAAVQQVLIQTDGKIVGVGKVTGIAGNFDKIGILRLISNNTSGIPFFNEETEISVFPNPATSSITIHSPNTITGLTIYNAIGETILSDFSEKNGEEIRIDLTNYKSGIYFIKTTSGDKVYLNKILKQN